MTIRTLSIALPCLIAGWIAVLSMVALTTDSAPAYVILFPPEGLSNALSEETAILSARQFSITVTSEEPGFAGSLYKKGALVVLPAGLPGCLPSAASI
jgi:hypothetical protein